MSFKKHGESEIIGKPIEIKDDKDSKCLIKEKTEKSGSKKKD